MLKNTLMASILFGLMAMTGCASTKIVSHQSSERMSVKDASVIVNELIMSDSNRYKPDRIEINKNYILWGYGNVTEHSGRMFGLLTAKSSTTHEKSERINFSSIEKFDLIKRENAGLVDKVTSNYYVRIDSKDNSKYALYTDDINKAKRLIDALNSLRLANKSDPAWESLSDTVTNSTSQKLRDLLTLKNDGLITDEEYQQKRKLLLEHF